jgi:tRNA nucleotidyltransferase (CCA-adding enzyme)
MPDIGKPTCYTEDENGGHFHGHGIPSRDITERVLQRLRFDNKTQKDVTELVLYHDSVIEPTPKTVKRWLNKIGEEQLLRLLDIRMADILAHAEGTQESRIERCNAVRGLAGSILAEKQCFTIKDLSISGTDVLDLGVPQGKLVGEILNHLLDKVISGELDNKREILIDESKYYLSAYENKEM